MKKVMLMIVLALMSVPAFAQDHNLNYGVGADIVAYRSENPLLDKVTIEVRHDIEASETRVFAVAEVDLFSIVADKFGGK